MKKVREVLFRLKLDSFEKALELVESIKAQAQEAKRAQQSAAEQTQEALTPGAGGAKGGQSPKVPGSGALGARFNRSFRNERGPRHHQDLGAHLSRANAVRDLANSLFEVAQSPSAGGAASLIGSFVPGPVGMVLSVMGPVIQQLEGFVERKIEQKVQKLESRVLAEQEERRLRDNYSRRINEDVEFERLESQAAYWRDVRSEQVYGKRLHRSHLLGDL